MSITITWDWEDIQSLRPELGQEQCEALLTKFSKTLTDRSVEEGWQILSDLLTIHEYDMKREAV